MAKGSAKEDALGALHAQLAVTFTRILEEYAERMEDVDFVEPSPAMMGAISKFLKDNSISFDTEEINQLSDTEQRLIARRNAREGLVNLTNLKLVDNG